MPTYGTKNYESGFYNNKNIGGVNDRVYSAEKMNEPYNSVFTNGVMPNENGSLGSDLQVTFVSNMIINVTAGRGLFGGHWFWNKSAFRITLDSAGLTNRYDCVIVQSNENDNVRDSIIYVKSIDHVPTIADLTRTDSVKEYCLAYILVTAQSVSISQSAITDCRLNNNLCGIITGVFNQFDGAALYAQLQASFTEWFNDVKDTFLASATLIRAYSNNYITQTANITIIPIGIPQYNRNLDTLIVYINGQLLPISRYTINSNSQITLEMGLPVIGTEVTFEVWKSIDGSDALTIVAEVGDIQNWRNNDVNKKLEHHYYCNGINDNVLIGNLVRSFNNIETYSSIRLIVHGIFGCTSPASGSGTSSIPYSWFRFYRDIVPTCRVIIDFSDCSEINIPLIEGAYNTIFLGSFVDVYGANVIAENPNAIVRVSTSQSTAGSYFKAEKCRFYISGSNDSFISYIGDFVNCYGRVINETGNSWCFKCTKYVRLFGGEYLAYHNETTGITSAVGYISSNSMAIFASGVSCPNVSKAGYDQTWAWYSESANKLTAIGTITQNPSYIEGTIINEDGENTRNIIGTIPLNMPNII